MPGTSSSASRPRSWRLQIEESGASLFASRGFPMHHRFGRGHHRPRRPSAELSGDSGTHARPHVPVRCRPAAPVQRGPYPFRDFSQHHGLARCCRLSRAVLGEPRQSRRAPDRKDFRGSSPGGRRLPREIAELKAHHESRLAEALAIVTEEAGATAYEIASKMTWSIRARDWSDFPLAQKWFAVGEAASHLDHLRERSL